MARREENRLKQALLLGFVAVCLVLVLLIWVGGLQGDGSALPGYYRNGAPGATLAITIEPASGTTVHRGPGGGQGGGQHATAEPTRSNEPTPTWPTLDDDSA